MRLWYNKYINYTNHIKVGLFVGNLGNEALIVTRDDEVFALGSNGAGCLGLGDMHSTLAPKQVEPLCYKVRTESNHPSLFEGL